MIIFHHIFLFHFILVHFLSNKCDPMRNSFGIMGFSLERIRTKNFRSDYDIEPTIKDFYPWSSSKREKKMNLLKFTIENSLYNQQKSQIHTYMITTLLPDVITLSLCHRHKYTSYTIHVEIMPLLVLTDRSCCCFCCCCYC